MRFHYRETVAKLFDIFHSSPGSTSRPERDAAEQRAGIWAMGAKPPHDESLSPELQRYLRKVALHAYKVTDEDVQALTSAGYSEDEIFELTIAAVLGAGRARLDLGLSLLHRGEA